MNDPVFKQILAVVAGIVIGILALLIGECHVDTQKQQILDALSPENQALLKQTQEWERMAHRVTP